MVRVLERLDGMAVGKIIARLECVVLLSVPFAAVLMAPFLDACRRASPSTSAIYALLVVLALFLLTSPLIIESLQRRKRKSVHQSADDLAPLLLLIGEAGSGTVSFIGVISVCFGNASGMQVYGWIAISVACMLFYAWRYRRALF